MPRTDRLIRLLAPVPPMIEAALGYYENADFVAFYWAQSGDELASHDSLGNGYVGANWNAWQVFVQHPVIEPFLSPFDLGNSDVEARHWLLLDRKQRVFYVGTAEEVHGRLSERILSQQESPIEIDEADFNARIEQQVVRLKKALSDWDNLEFAGRMALEQKATNEMRDWLGIFWQTQNIPKA